MITAIVAYAHHAPCTVAAPRRRPRRATHGATRARGLPPGVTRPHSYAPTPLHHIAHPDTRRRGRPPIGERIAPPTTSSDRHLIPTPVHRYGHTTT